MKVVHVLRKPCSEGTVAANVLRYGCGAMNIDKTRIGDWQTRLDPACNKGDTGRARFNTLGPVNTTGYTNSETKNGRWPANLILQHLPGCVQDGTRTVRGEGHFPATRPTGSIVSGPAGHRGQTGLAERHLTSETVAAWVCAPGCPVAGLDAQSGVSKSTGGRTGNKDGGGIYGGGKGLAGVYSPDDPGYGDTGGASRFFKQVKA